MSILLNQLMNGLSNSAIILLAALGMVVIFGNMKIVNLAHGEFIMAGAYFTYLLHTVMGMPYFVSVLIAVVGTALLGALLEKTVMKRFYGRLEETLLASYALSILMAQVFKMSFGMMTKKVDKPVSANIKLGTIVFPAYNLVIIGCAILAVTIVVIIFFKTSLGTKIRAISQNREMAQAIGINTKKIDTLTFAFGAALAGFAGGVIAPARVVIYTMGSQYLLDSFFTVVIGGLDSLLGTTISAVLIGEGNMILSGYMSEVTAGILILLFIIVMIRVKPEGLFTKERRG